MNDDIEQTRRALAIEDETRERARAVISSAGAALAAIESARGRLEGELHEIEAKRKRALKRILFGSALIGVVVLALLLFMHARSLSVGG